MHVLSAAAVQHGFKEDYEALGISESKEVELALAHRRELWEGSRWDSFHQVPIYIHAACDLVKSAAEVMILAYTSPRCLPFSCYLISE